MKSASEFDPTHQDSPAGEAPAKQPPLASPPVQQAPPAEPAATLTPGKTAKRKLVLAAGLTALLVAGAMVLWRAGLLQVISNKHKLVQSLRATGMRGPLTCVAAQFIQVVIFAIPGEITQFAAGYVFGIWKGFVYSVIGIMLGSAFNFYFAQIVGRPTVAKLLGKDTLDKVDRLLNSAKGKSAMFLLFLVPGTPKDAMCYGAGLCNMSLWEFVVITGLGRAPALIASVVLGSQVSRRDYDAVILTSVAAAGAVLGYYFYERRPKGQQSVAAKRDVPDPRK